MIELDQSSRLVTNLVNRQREEMSTCAKVGTAAYPKFRQFTDKALQWPIYYEFGIISCPLDSILLLFLSQNLESCPSPTKKRLTKDYL